MTVSPNLNQLLQVLCDSKLDFVIIGGFAGVLHGSSLVTRDLDIAMFMKASNLNSLRNALKDFHPFHRRTLPKLSFMDVPDKWDGLKNLYLETDLGVLDVLGELPDLGNLDAVLMRAKQILLFKQTIKVLSLEDLIKAKRALGRPKDLMMVQELEKIKEGQA